MDRALLEDAARRMFGTDEKRSVVAPLTDIDRRFAPRLESEKKFVRHLNARLGRSLPEDRGVSSETSFRDYLAAVKDEGWLR